MIKKSIPGFRHQVIDSCLCNKCNKWTKGKLIDCINQKLYEQHGIEGISDSTFYSDIKTMKSEWPRGYNAPIECINGAYIYTDPDFTIQKDNLSDVDIEVIDNAITVLSQFKQLPIHHELSLVQEKILGYSIHNDENEQIIEFEKQIVKGAEFLTPLYKLIKDKKVIKVLYHSFKSQESKEYIVHPYYLKQYRHRWYLISYCETHKLITTYSLDRILDIEEVVGVKFREVDNKSIRDRFKDIIGITRIADHELQQINIWVSKKLMPYIKTKPIHNSQKILSEDEKGMKITLNLIPNYEFYSIILSFGESIRILSPDLIRDELASKLESASKMYNASVNM
ncbi:helix-turn-helix transcriptional regulator [Ancylomarina longa]|uniref:WYL domain-containing protein n=1 Tax=Ancylomarina longa TaxID=2487017 RepID=A0A434AX06_9BACT|nr:WYL domain-containing protein [Ancylomarina longa]RUT78937.1 WYL domain-containing protein [Ancylomarina longa]